MNTKLKKALDDHPNSISQIIRESNISRSALYRWINGKVDPLPVHKNILCNYMGKTEKQLGWK